WLVYEGSSALIRNCIEQEPGEVNRETVLPQQGGKGWVKPVEDVRLVLKNPMLLGRNNAFKASCTLGTAMKMGVTEEEVKEALESFVNDPHRLEPVAEIEGVKYINDSKATNVDAVQFALEGVKSPIVWIAGGTDKGNDYSAIDSLVEDKVAALIILADDSEALSTHFDGKVPLIKATKSVEEAVKWAAALAEPGSTVLLSPACASFDLFKNYKDRGDRFKDAVRQLIKDERR